MNWLDLFGLKWFVLGGFVSNNYYKFKILVNIEMLLMIFLWILMFLYCLELGVDDVVLINKGCCFWKKGCIIKRYM